jgi:predicted ATP-dependent serine protease
VVGFGSNVQPSKFGKGSEQQKDWDCFLCGNTNRKWWAVCQSCNQTKELGELARSTDPLSSDILAS